MSGVTLIDRLVAWASPEAGVRRAIARRSFEALATGRRGYDGAARGRRTDGWRAPGTSADAEVAAAGGLLRDRMRDLVRNNPHAAKAVSVLVNNIVGSGVIGPGVSVAIIRKMPDATDGFGDTRVVLPTVVMDVRRSDISTPAEGDLVVIGASTFKVIGTPMIDRLGMVWACELVGL